MDALPTEILELIFIYAQSISFGVVNKRMHRIHGNIHIQTKAILYKFNVWKPFHNIPVNMKQFCNMFNYHLWKPEHCVCLMGLPFGLKTEYMSIFLEYSCQTGSLEIAKNVCSFGISNTQLSIGLVQASLRNRPLIMRYLLMNGAKIEYNSTACLSCACKHGFLECVKVCLEFGCDIFDGNGYAICMAAKNGNLDVFKLLVDYGGTRVIHANHNRPVQWACEYGHLELAEYLIQNNANIHSNDEYALRWSSARGHLKIVSLLLTNGANLHAANDFALRHAVKMDHFSVADLLLEYGANAFANQSEAILWVSKNGSPEMKNVFMSRNLLLDVI